MSKKIIIFHGGCHGCTQQIINPIEFCMGCQYFDADWKLPNLSNRPEDESERMRRLLKEKYSRREIDITPEQLKLSNNN